MVRDITIGQFFPGKSFLHKMDARVKIVLSILIIVLIFLANNFLSLGFIVLFVLYMVFVSKVSFLTVMKSVKPIIPILIVMSLFNIFGSSGEPILQVAFLKITENGLNSAGVVCIRIITLIISSSILTYTTSPNDLTDAIERLLSPLRLLKVDVHTIAMMMTIALRFIPTLIEEVDKIMNAQKARGANLDSGNFAQRAKALIPVFIPLFVSSIRRAYELAYAMECRCYRGGEGRTRMKQMKISSVDVAAVFIFVCCCVCVLLLNIL